MELTHASFFSGVGGLDMGLERAGWRTVSFSEIDPYASAVLAERWPGVPNLGDITHLARARAAGVEHGLQRGSTLWTGGFPCQDLSVAGKRRGMGVGTRSGLAFAFLDLAAVHRPRFVLLENVPGLLSSHGGRDMAALLGALVELGYGVGYRVLDARHFGVPQRRRRVFILGDSAGGRAGAERAAEVLSVGSRCHRHPPTGIQAGEGTADGADDGVIGTLREHVRPGSNTDHSILGPSPDPYRVRAADGLGGRAHDRDVVNALDQRRGGADDNEAQAGHLVTANALRASDGHHGHGSPRGDGGDNLVATLRVGGRSQGAGSSYDNTPYTVTDPYDGTEFPIPGPGGMTDDPMLPLGLDSHRYRCCGNGVVADVAEWIGLRLAAIA